MASGGGGNDGGNDSTHPGKPAVAGRRAARPAAGAVPGERAAHLVAGAAAEDRAAHLVAGAAAKRARLILAARLYLAAHAELARLPARFDCVLFEGGGEPEWIRGAFDAG